LGAIEDLPAALSSNSAMRRSAINSSRSLTF
jgi:hypothetical protein